MLKEKCPKEILFAADGWEMFLQGDKITFCRETKPFLQGGGAGTLVLQVDSIALEDTGMPSIVGCEEWCHSTNLEAQ